MSPRPIDHPLAIAKMVAEVKEETISAYHVGFQMAQNAAASARQEWRRAGCPLYQEPDTTGDDDAR